MINELCVDKPRIKFGPNSLDAKYGRDLLLGIWKLTDTRLAAHPATTPWAAYEQLKLLSAALVMLDSASGTQSAHG